MNLVNKLLLVLLFPICGFSQNLQFSIGIDAKNAIVGSDATGNNKELNYLFEFAMVSRKGIEVTIGYESFKAIKFDKYSVQVGYQFNPLKRVKIIPSLSYNIIGRYGEQWGSASSHLAVGANVGLRYNLSDTFDIELMGQGLQRVDLNTKYGGTNNNFSGFVKLIYKIKV